MVVWHLDVKPGENARAQIASNPDDDSLYGHKDAVNCVNFSHDGTKV